MKHTIRNAKALLKTNGLLVINEISENNLFTHLTFGLLDGWWLYEDTDMRIPGCPGLYSETWEHLLIQEGFTSIDFPVKAYHDLGQQTIVSQSNGLIRQSTVKTEKKQFQPAMVMENKPVVKTNVETTSEPEKIHASASEQKYQLTNDQIEDMIIDHLSESLDIDARDIDIHDSFADYGLDSITASKLIQSINDSLNIELKASHLFDYTSVTKLCLFIAEECQPDVKDGLPEKVIETEPSASKECSKNKFPICKRQTSQTGQTCPTCLTLSDWGTNGAPQKSKIAIIGMSARFSQAENVDDLWQLLVNGKDAIEKVGRWDIASYFQDGNFCDHAALIDNFDQFDANFFNISSLEASYMDPQQRLFLEEAWHALEDSGYAGADMDTKRRFGVYVGCHSGDYQYLLGDVSPAQAMWGNAGSVIPARISYYLNLQGPAVAVDTACSSSSVAIHIACQALWNKEIDYALAGGVSVQSTPSFLLSANRAQMLSSTGRCFVFDHRADGFVPVEGVGVLVLKRLDDAIKDRDQIYGVICGTGVNQDGTTNGITAPSGNSQKRLICQVYDDFDIHPEQIQMVEAHGTGTIIGDPIEFDAICRAFEQYTSKNGFCSIGSMKTNVGHTLATAGVAGLIRVLLALKHQTKPPSLNHEQANPDIHFQDSPFYVNTSPEKWESTSHQQRMGLVSSFGFSGTNSHIVIQEAPPVDVQPDNKPAFLIVLSAVSFEQLQKQANLLIDYCENNAQEHPGNISFTLLTGRKNFHHRLACIVKTVHDIPVLLNKWLVDGNASSFFLGKVNEKVFKEKIEQKEKGHACLKDCQNLTDTGLYVEKLSSIANLFIQGYDLDFQILFEKDRCGRISLPTYPFTRERYWLTDSKKSQMPEKMHQTDHPESPQKEIETSEPQSSHEKQASLSSRAVMMKKSWEICLPAPTRSVRRDVIVLANNQSMTLANMLYQYFPTAHIISLDDQNDFSTVNWKNIDGCIDLIGCCPQIDSPTQYIEQTILVLQQLIESGHKEGITLLCVTSCLESLENNTINMSGALRAGLYRMLQSEYHHIQSRHMDTDQGITDDGLAYSLAYEFMMNTTVPEICYRQGTRYQMVLSEIPYISGDDQKINFPSDQVLLITGGTRGLGWLCARHFVEKYHVRHLVLTGRDTFPPKDQWQTGGQNTRALSEKITAILNLEKQYNIHVKVSDVSLNDKQALLKLKEEIQTSMGQVGGIIHCAGLFDSDNPAFIRKHYQKIAEVLLPKVEGLSNVYKVFASNRLSFFTVFSSVSGIIPYFGAGQSDYAMANAYMDYFAMAKKKECPIISIQWPGWEQTGIFELKSNAFKQSGMVNLKNDQGLTFLDQIIVQKPSENIMPLMIDEELWYPEHLSQRYHQEEAPNENTQNKILESKPAETGSSDLPLEDATQNWLISLFSSELKIKKSKIDPDKLFPNYGVDSILLTQLLSQINKVLGKDLDPSVLYEFPSISSLTAWLVSAHGALLKKGLNIQKQVVEKPKNSIAPIEKPEQLVPPKGESNMNIPVQPPQQAFKEQKSTPLTSQTDIAVIGISCRFPGANSVDEYWELLSQGKNAIKPVPESRFGYATNYYAGLLDNITDFDRHFFHIPPEDLRVMDPQALVGLEESLHVFYHAGYSHKDMMGKSIGVYLGARSAHMPEDYQLLQAKNPIVTVGQNYLAANISHFFDLQGPAVVIDTACSSALVGMNMAIQSLINHDISLALVGGVSLITSDKVHRMFAQRNILSNDPFFHIFDQQASGVVPGEGAGMVLLKRLDRAIAENDTIYAIIKACEINNDGRTAGPATPNVKAQKNVMLKALEKARGVHPQDICYIDVNGSGSEVTDLLELKAIKSVYRNASETSCSLGCIKPNIGHPLNAEGIASLIKVVLMLNHKQLVPFLSANKPMMHFDFKTSPFEFCRKLTHYNKTPMIAALNSFADGGTNAHVILQSYDNSETSKKPLAPPQLQRENVYKHNWFWKRNGYKELKN